MQIAWRMKMHALNHVAKFDCAIPAMVDRVACKAGRMEGGVVSYLSKYQSFDASCMWDLGLI
jgi:hypothetical protein